MRVHILLAGLGLTAALAACSPTEAAHDVAYYRDHQDERAAKMAECRNDPGRLEKTPNCLNALRADADAMSEKAWGAPKPQSRLADPGHL